MEHGERSGQKRSLEAEFIPKRQMKSSSQLQILEAAYAVARRPSQQMKEELARMTGLDYMQVQYWFGNRRYFDRHGPRSYKPRIDHDDSLGRGKSVQVVPEINPSRTSSASLVTVLRDRPLLNTNSLQVEPEFNPSRTSAMSLVTVARDRPLLTEKSVQAAFEFNRGSTSSMTLVTVAIAGPSLTGSISSRRHELLQTVVPAGPSNAQPGVGLALPSPLQMMTQSHLLLIHQKLQRMVTHVENKLGHPLRADGPILGTEFEPLPPGAFGDHLANTEQKGASQPCDDKEIERAKLESAKASPILPMLEYGSVRSSFIERDFTDQDALVPYAEAPRAVHKYQLFPMQQNWTQNINQTYFSVSSVNTSDYQGQTSNKHAHATSSVPFQCEISDATHQFQQGDVKIMSSLAEYQKSPNLVLNAPDDCHAVFPLTDLGNPFPSTDKSLGDEMEKTQIHQSGSAGVDEIQHFYDARISATAALEEANNKNCYQTMQNPRKRQRPCGLLHCHGYDRYIVMPREGPETTLADARGTSYFCNVDDSCIPLIAEWNEKEGRAVYIVDYNDSIPCMSSRTDSSLSGGYDDEATENVNGYADGKPMEVTSVDDEAAENM